MSRADPHEKPDALDSLPRFRRLSAAAKLDPKPDSANGLMKHAVETGLRADDPTRDSKESFSRNWVRCYPHPPPRGGRVAVGVSC